MEASFLKRYSLATPLLLIIIVGVLGWTLILRPALKDFRLARQELRAAQEQAAKTQARLKELRGLQTQAQLGTPAEVEKLQALFVQPPELATLLQILEQNAKTARFVLVSLEVGQERSARASSGPLQELLVQVQLKGGGYQELKEFLKLTTQTTPLLEVSSFTLDPKSASVSMNLKALSVREEQAAPAPLSPVFFQNPQFKALRAPLPPAVPASAGRENPFAPVEPPLSPTPPLPPQ